MQAIFLKKYLHKLIIVLNGTKYFCEYHVECMILFEDYVFQVLDQSVASFKLWQVYIEFAKLSLGGKEEERYYLYQLLIAKCWTPLSPLI